MLFRVPPLLNAGAVNSDAAVVGLQAIHLLKGEWSSRLWGTSYQGSLDALLAAFIFLFTGPTPLGLYLVPLLGAGASIAVWFDLLRRHLHPWAALACVMPLTIVPLAINVPMLIVVRQSLATLVCCAAWLCWRAGATKQGWPLLALGGLLIGLSLWVDFFAITLIPALAVLAVGAAWTGAPGESIRARLRPFATRFSPIAIGVGVGLFATWRLRHRLGGGTNGAIDTARIGHNLELLIHTCLPFTLGTKVFIKGGQAVAVPWDAPAPVVVLQWAGALGLVALLLLAVPLVAARKTPPAIRWFGLGGLAAAGAALAGFLLSVMPQDMWSVRYLAPLLWMSPLWLAPPAWWLTRRGLWVVLAPYLVSTAIGGWLSYDRYVDGPFPRKDARAYTESEQALLETLKADGVQAVAAEYWLAYRLTLLWREELIAVPLDSADDRYRPYRLRYEAASKKALVFHPFEARTRPETYVEKLTADGVPFTTRQVGGFTVLELP